MSLLDALNPIKGVVDTVNGIIGKFVADPKEKAEAQLALLQASTDLQKAVMEAEQKIVDSQSKIIIAEAQSQSWLPRNVRPLILLGLFIIILYQALFVSLFKLHPIDLAMVPDKLWELLTVGFGGYVAGRTLEKIVPGVVTAIKGK